MIASVANCTCRACYRQFLIRKRNDLRRRLEVVNLNILAEAIEQGITLASLEVFIERNNS